MPPRKSQKIKEIKGIKETAVSDEKKKRKRSVLENQSEVVQRLKDTKSSLKKIIDGIPANSEYAWMKDKADEFIREAENLHKLGLLTKDPEVNKWLPVIKYLSMPERDRPDQETYRRKGEDDTSFNSNGHYARAIKEPGGVEACVKIEL